MFSFGCFLAPVISEAFLSTGTSEESRLLLEDGGLPMDRKAALARDLLWFLRRRHHSPLRDGEDAAAAAAAGGSGSGSGHKLEHPGGLLMLLMHPKRLWFNGESGIALLYPLIGKPSW